MQLAYLEPGNVNMGGMNGKQGRELIRSQLTEIPELPGIYRMLDSSKNIIYIGKAKNLKNRLVQYTLTLEGKNKIMINLVASLEYSLCETESSALVLESQLIKKYKPKFNILLKDDKSFPYIKLNLNHEYPQLQKYRGKNLGSGKLFGPYASTKHVDTALTEIQKIFRLRTCTDSYFKNRDRPCIQYQIKRCLAPCVNKISKKEYQEIILEVKDFLSGKSQKLQKILSKKMELLSENMEYEKAAEIRDRINAISYVQLKSDSVKQIDDVDVIALATKNGEFCIELFIYRSSHSCGNQDYFPVHTYDATPSEVIESFIMQIYQDKKPPKELIISHDISNKQSYELALKKLHKNSVRITKPKFGTKKKILDNAILNADLALEKRLKVSAKNISSLKEVQKLFDLSGVPGRIEVYDNSHIQGAFPVGAMIVAGRDGFEKKEYRLFNIKEPQNSSRGGDDYAMLREVLTRRIKRLKTEPYRIPDLMIIDGGKGHMKIVMEVMQKLNTNIPFVCMSKGVDRNSGKEQFHRPNREIFTLDRNLEVMKYLQILRDEVHAFAIKSHRGKRSKAIKISSLDNIPAIGSVRKKALLNYFGSFKSISEATFLELSKVEGISKKIAASIYEALR